MPDILRQSGEFIVSSALFTALHFVIIAAGLIAGFVFLLKRRGSTDHRTPGVVCFAMAAAGIGLTVYWVRNTHHCEIRIVNAAPYTLAFATTHALNPKEWLTAAWKSVGPGGTYTYKQTVRGVKPEFQVYAESVRPDVILFATRGYVVQENGQPIDVVTYPGAGLERHLPPLGESKLYKTRKFNMGQEFTNGLKATFTSIPLVNRDANLYQIVLREPMWFPELHRPVDGENELHDVTRRASAIGASLNRQVQYEKEWATAMILPFSLGIVPSDSNGPLVRGVEIADHIGAFPDGRALPFNVGDLLISLGGTEVYGVYDIGSLLHYHATSEYLGIQQPIAFKVVRDGKELAGRTTYLFVKEFFDRRNASLTEGGSLAAGVFGGVTFGFDSEARATLAVGARQIGNGIEWLRGKFQDNYTPHYAEGPSWSTTKWGVDQEKAMRKQWFKDAYTAGEIGSLFVNLPRSFLKAALPRSARPMMNTMAARVFFEVVETGIWEAKDGDALRTRDEMFKDIERAVPWAAVGGVAQGVFGSRGPTRAK